MREIKFRAKTLAGNWQYGSVINITKEFNGEDFEKCDYWELITDDSIEFTINKETLGQFTGLYDKNKVPIYERGYSEKT